MEVFICLLRWLSLLLQSRMKADDVMISSWTYDWVTVTWQEIFMIYLLSCCPGAIHQPQSRHHINYQVLYSLTVNIYTPLSWFYLHNTPPYAGTQGAKMSAIFKHHIKSNAHSKAWTHAFHASSGFTYLGLYFVKQFALEKYPFLRYTFSQQNFLSSSHTSL